MSGRGKQRDGSKSGTGRSNRRVVFKKKSTAQPSEREPTLFDDVISEMSDLSDDKEEDLSSKECSKKCPDRPVKGKVISLQEKINILSYASNVSERDAARAFGVSKTSVNQIKKNGKRLLTLNEVSRNTGNPRCRAFRKTPLDKVNRKTWKWLLKKLKKGDHVTNKELQAEATVYAHLAGMENFTASNGWLYSFKKRFGITLCRSKVLVKDPEAVGAYLEAEEDMKDSGSEQFSDSDTDEEGGNRFLKIRHSSEATRKAALKGFKAKTAVRAVRVRPTKERLYF
ncbi:major centromere autoantigen B-like [Ischnura elegans]|uniref:major centromere autoantigen B-like n=1 Tax=Ischnura elegans TaxID=197161 RepID=UPI001ED8A33D|nr:major centromere autoantigen B-like [Ischnura elegans]XP_046387453.1 major centromere autoantigen B-like [Ischnura elegans]